MNSVPLVSIGVPTFNRPKQLHKTIQYLIKQDYKNIEIIISDNCSTDISVNEILEKYKNEDNRITYYIQKSNIEIEPNFNFVYHKAKGKYFMWVSDDDEFDHNYIAECVTFLEQHQEYVLCSGISKYYNQSKFLFEEKTIHLESNIPLFRLLHYFRKVYKNGIFYGVYRNNLGFQNPIQKHLGGDWNHIARTALLGKINVLDTIKVKRSDEGGSSSREKMTTRWKLNQVRKIFFETYVAYQVVKYLFNEPVILKKYPIAIRLPIQLYLFVMLNLKFLIHSIRIRLS